MSRVLDRFLIDYPVEVLRSADDVTSASDMLSLEFDPHQRRDENGRWVQVTRIHEHGIDPKRLATRFYVGAGFRKLNKALESGAPVHSLPSRYVDVQHKGAQFHTVEIYPEDVVEHLDAAIADAPLTSSMTLYRGASASSVSVGDVVSRRGYLSTTGTKSQAHAFINNDGDGLWVITAPKGSHALKIDEGPNTHEDEYVLPRNARLRVTSVDTSGSQPVVHAEIINDLTAGFDSHEPRWPKNAPGGKGGEWRDDTPGILGVSLPKVTPTKAIYRAQIPHDEVVAVSSDGATRMRWDQSQKKFIRERKSGDGWQHQKTLNKKQAYDQLKNEDDWHSPSGSAPSTPTPAPKKAAPKKATQTDTKVAKIEDVPSSQTPEQPSPVVSPASKTSKAHLVPTASPDEVDALREAVPSVASELSVDSANLPTGAQPTLISPTTAGDFDYRITTAKSGKSAIAAAPYNSNTEDSLVHEDLDSGLGYTYQSPVDDFHGSGLSGMDVREAVSDYSDNGYETVNPALRESGGDPAQFPEHMKALGYSQKRARKVAAGVDAAMAASPLSDDVVVERGIVDPAPIFGANWDDADLTGRDWTDQGYVSTTAGQALGKFSGNGAGIQMRVLVPAGTHAIGVEAATAGLAGENELLLDRGLTYRVVHDHGTVDGRRKIDVEVVPKGTNTPDVAAPATPSAVDELATKIETPDAPSITPNASSKVKSAELKAAEEKLAKLDVAIAESEQRVASSTKYKSLHKQYKEELTSLQASRAKVATQVAALAPPKEGSTELENIRIQLDSIAEEAKSHAQVVMDTLHKDNMGKVLTEDDLKRSHDAEAELKSLSAKASKLAERELELRMENEGEPWGGDDAPGSWKGAAESKFVPGTNAAKIETTRDSYVANDRQTIQNNASLRSDNPTPAAKAWRGRMRAMVRSSRIARDTTVYRGAAFTPEMVMSLQPGTTLHDVGMMSTDDSEDGARFYIEARRSKLPGTLPVLFDIKVPEGTPGIDVGVGEFVFDAETSLRIIKLERGKDGVIRVTAEMIPPGKVKKAKAK